MTSRVFQIKVALQDLKPWVPSIWRRLQVPASMRLDLLHQVLQVAMGWQDVHIHEFERNRRRFGVRPDGEFDADLSDESKVPLEELIKRQGDSMLYSYDFGDDWRHLITLERIEPAKPSIFYPICIDGEGHCPPEDVGGADGYDAFVRTLSYRYLSEYRATRKWGGENFDPYEFGVQNVNAALHQHMASLSGSAPA